MQLCVNGTIRNASCISHSATKTTTFDRFSYEIILNLFTKQLRFIANRTNRRLLLLLFCVCVCTVPYDDVIHAMHLSSVWRKEKQMFGKGAIEAIAQICYESWRSWLQYRYPETQIIVNRAECVHLGDVVALRLNGILCCG